MIAPAAKPSGRQAVAALLIVCGFLASPALAQTPPGFESIPRPPGSIGPPSLMPPGSQSGVLAPQTPSSPLPLSPPPAQPAPLPPSVPAPAPPPAVSTVPMVPPGQVALMVNARFGR